MMILLLFALGLSFLCAVTLIAACMISGQSADDSEGFSAVSEDEEWQSMKTPTTHLRTTSTPLT